jgi:hypothetical protein
MDEARNISTNDKDLKQYFLSGDGIDRYVIQSDITRYLGPDATARPYSDRDGRQGYLIRAFQPLTTVSDAQMGPRWEGMFRVITEVIGND